MLSSGDFLRNESFQWGDQIITSRGCGRETRSTARLLDATVPGIMKTASAIRSVRCVSAVLALSIAACGDHTSTSPNPDDGFPSGIGALTVVPVDSVGEIVPLGHIQPVGHTLPTDHIYFYFRKFHGVSCAFCGTPTPTQQVRAPAAGTVTFIIQPGGTDYKVQARMTKTTYWYLDHVALSPSIHVGSVLHAGDVIGTTPAGSIAIDLGYLNYDITQPFVKPIRYGESTLHSDAPLKYYAEPLRTQLYAKVLRPAGVSDLDGGIAFDVDGHLAGNWFHESLAETEGAGMNSDGWSRSLTFAPDEYDPRIGRIVWGGYIGPINVYAYKSTDPRPADVTPASGIVHYHLNTIDPNTGFTYDAGELVVQMTATDRIKIEYGASFTSAALIYKR